MDGPARELTPDEIVAEIEAMKPRKRKVTIYQSWPRMILERERKNAAAIDEMEALTPSQQRQVAEQDRRVAIDSGLRAAVTAYLRWQRTHGEVSPTT